MSDAIVSASRLDLSNRGRTGLPLWAGRLYEDYMPVLQGERGRAILREMSEQDPIIGGILYSIEMLARQVKWTVQASGTAPKKLEAAVFVDECLRDMSPSFDDALSEALSMLVYGWSYLEILYKRRVGPTQSSPIKKSSFTDGKIGWRGWAIRAQETLYEWQYDDPFDPVELVGMIQMPPPTYQRLTIPRDKALHFRTKSRRQSPEGVSVLRTCYRPWYLKKNIETIEGIGIERDLAGLPVIWVPPSLLSADASDDEKALGMALRKIVTNIRRDEQEGILMPLAYDEQGHETYKLELLSTGGSRQFDIDKTVDRYDQRIAMALMADFILLGHESVGSFALSDNKTALFATALGTFLDTIADEINSRAITKLCLLNGYKMDEVPHVVHGDIENIDISKLGPFLQQLTAAGMAIFPNPELERYILEQSGLPVPIVDHDATNPPEIPEPLLPQERIADAQAKAQAAHFVARNGGDAGQSAQNAQTHNEPEQFFNPNHDAGGRFASSGGRAAAAGMGPLSYGPGGGASSSSYKSTPGGTVNYRDDVAISSHEKQKAVDDAVGSFPESQVSGARFLGYSGTAKVVEVTTTDGSRHYIAHDPHFPGGPATHKLGVEKPSAPADTPKTTVSAPAIKSVPTKIVGVKLDPDKHVSLGKAKLDPSTVPASLKYKEGGVRPVKHYTSGETIGYAHERWSNEMNGSYSVGKHKDGIDVFDLEGNKLGFSSNDFGGRAILAGHYNKLQGLDH